MWRTVVQLSNRRRALVLAAMMLALGLALAPVAWVRNGVDGLLAEALAGGLSLAGALAALAMFARFPRADQVLHAMAGGMLLRSALPLAAGTALYLSQPWLAKAGLLVYLVAFYLPALALETVLLVDLASKTSGTRAGADAREVAHGRS